MILEYKMDRNSDGKLITPYWVECGGFMFNPANKAFIGFSPSVREYKIPNTVTVLTVEEAKARMQGIHTATPLNDIEGNEMTIDQVNDMVDAIILTNDMP